MELTKMYEDALGLPDGELEKLAKLLWEEVRERHKKVNVLAAMQFRVGQLVVNEHHSRRLPEGVVGKVLKVNNRALKVDFGPFRIWRMPGTMLKAAPKGAKVSLAQHVRNVDTGVNDD